MTDLEKLRVERSTGLGSSDAASLFNIGYGCQRRLVYEKRGTVPDYPVDDKLVFRRGILLEPLAAQEYSDKTSRALTAPTLLRDRIDHELIAHADRFIIQKETERRNTLDGVLELKTMNSYVFRKLKTEGMQDEHQLQVQWAIMVAGVEWGSYAALHPDSWDMIYFDIQADKSMHEDLRAQGIETWKMVENGPLPDRLPVDDRRCLSCAFRNQCQGEALKELLGQGAQPKETFDESLEQYVEAYTNAQQLVKSAEEVQEECRAELEEKLGDRILVETLTSRVSFKPQTSKRVHTETLKKRFPEAYRESLRESVSRPLRVFPRK